MSESCACLRSVSSTVMVELCWDKEVATEIVVCNSAAGGGGDEHSADG